MNRRGFFNLLALVSTLGIMGWRTTDFFGGMILYLLSYPVIIIPIIILYTISLLETIVSIIKYGVGNNKIKVLFHGLFFLTVIIINMLQSDLFKSKEIFTATLTDDLYHYKLVFRENGDCENKVSGIFGFEQVHYGKYKLYGDTIVFEKVPYDNDFIPDTLLIDRNEKAIFIDRDEAGNFYTENKWLNHFVIQ